MNINMLISFAGGALMGLFITVHDGREDHRIAVRAIGLITECQQGIPRDQYCELIAVQENIK